MRAFEGRCFVGGAKFRWYSRSRKVLMPSTPSAYPQVAWRRLASFRVVNSGVFPVQRDLCAWFDFPAAPLEKGRPEQRFVFPCLADINRPSTSASQVSTTLGSTQ